MHISFAPFLQFDGPINKIYLWGMMGAGKSTYGKRIAASLGWEWVDLDDMIENTEGRSISLIFEREGEAYFRTLEKSCLAKLNGQQKIVVSTGGGTPCFSDHADLMLDQGLSIWLDAPAGALAKRLETASVERPLIRSKKGETLVNYLQELLDERSTFYKKAHLIVNVMQMKPKELSDHLVGIIQERS